MIILKEKSIEEKDKEKIATQTINELKSELQNNKMIIEQLNKQIEQLKGNNFGNHLENNDVVLHYYPYKK